MPAGLRRATKLVLQDRFLLCTVYCIRTLHMWSRERRVSQATILLGLAPSDKKGAWCRGSVGPVGKNIWRR